MFSLTITSPSDADQRIDKFMKKYLPNAPLGGIYKWLRTGKVKINGKKVDQNYRIQGGDILSFFLTDNELEGFRQKVEEPEGMPANIGLNILYEDESLLIVDKPPGINVHPGDHKTKEVSLIEQVQDSLGTKYNTLTFRPSLVHRIDRDTTGCLLIAKEKKALESLLVSLQGGEIKKVYHTITIGTPEVSQGTIRTKLSRIENAQNEAKVQVDPIGGQEAITHYSTLDRDIQGKYSLLECQIETGRTHQIRVHMASIGHPILGDQSYGNRSENSYAKRELGISRQLLHAESLTFPHPVTKKTITIHATYPDDFLRLLKK